jgi:hypothetical protein
VTDWYRDDKLTITISTILSAAEAELMQSRPDIVLASGPEIALQTIVAAKGGVPIVMIEFRSNRARLYQQFVAARWRYYRRSFNS